MSLKKELTGALCLLLCLILFCWAAARVLTPKRHDYGAVWDMYLQEPEDSVDVLFLGSSLAYCDVVPAVLYEETGVTSFVMAGPEQTFPVTYRYLREACRTQSPKTVFVEATRLLAPLENRSVKVNITYMPFGLNKLTAAVEETEGSERTGLLFPLYAYHDRWDSLNARDLEEGIFGYSTDPLAGYTFLDRVTPCEETCFGDYTDDWYPYSEGLGYAKKMLEFCEERGIRLVFFFSPYVERPYNEQRTLVAADMAKMGAEFVDFNYIFDDFGFDLSVDFYDKRHLNYRGAEKFTRYLAGRLEEWDAVPSGAGDEALWRERVDHFAELREEWNGKKLRMNESLENK